MCGDFSPRSFFIANAFVEQYIVPTGAMIRPAISNERIFSGCILDQGLFPLNCLFGLSLIPYSFVTHMVNGTLFWIVFRIIFESYPN